MDERVEPLPDAPEGTCVPMHPPGSGIWRVRGRAGWFRVNEESHCCECSDFLAQKRRGITLTPCSHLRALARHRARLAARRSALYEERVEAMEPLSWTDADLRRIFS